jgi:hypothetical protein
MNTQPFLIPFIVASCIALAAVVIIVFQYRKKRALEEQIVFFTGRGKPLKLEHLPVHREYDVTQVSEGEKGQITVSLTCFGHAAWKTSRLITLNKADLFEFSRGRALVPLRHVLRRSDHLTVVRHRKGKRKVFLVKFGFPEKTNNQQQISARTSGMPWAGAVSM